MRRTSLHCCPMAFNPRECFRHVSDLACLTSANFFVCDQPALLHATHLSIDSPAFNVSNPSGIVGPFQLYIKSFIFLGRAINFVQRSLLLLCDAVFSLYTIIRNGLACWHQPQVHSRQEEGSASGSFRCPGQSGIQAA